MQDSGWWTPTSSNAWRHAPSRLASDCEKGDHTCSDSSRRSCARLSEFRRDLSSISHGRMHVICRGHRPPDRPCNLRCSKMGRQRSCCCKPVQSWRADRFLLESEVYPLMTTVLLWMAYFDALDGNADSLEKLNRPLGLARARRCRSEWQAAARARGTGAQRLLWQGLRVSSAAPRRAAGSARHGRSRAAVSAIAELALEVGTPQIIGECALRRRRAARAVARPAAGGQFAAAHRRADGNPLSPR